MIFAGVLKLLGVIGVFESIIAIRISRVSFFWLIELRIIAVVVLNDWAFSNEPLFININCRRSYDLVAGAARDINSVDIIAFIAY